MTMSFNFVSRLTIEETSKRKAIVSGILATTGISRNGWFYDLESLKEIAETSIGKPVFFGIKKFGYDRSTGLIIRNLHDDSEENRIGRIIKTVLNRKQRIVKFFAEVWNTKKFPNIVQKIKQGFGVSIKGTCHDAKLLIEKAKQKIFQIRDMLIQSVQIFNPQHAKAGIAKAKVESIEVQESMMFFYGNKPLNYSKLIELIAIVKAHKRRKK